MSAGLEVPKTDTLKRRVLRTVVLVNPPMTLEQRYGALASAGAMEPPFGLCYLAAVLRDEGYDVHIVDAEALGMGWAETAGISNSTRR